MEAHYKGMVAPGRVGPWKGGPWGGPWLRVMVIYMQVSQMVFMIVCPFPMKEQLHKMLYGAVL